MATYLELRSVFGDGDFRQKIETAVVIAAYKIMSGLDTSSPFDQTAGLHDLRIHWANDALSSTAKEAERIHKFVLAANAGATLAQIANAPDNGANSIQENVEKSIDAIAAAVYGV